MLELKYWLGITALITVIGLIIVSSIVYFYFRSFQKRMEEINRIAQLPLEEQYKLGSRRSFDFSDLEGATKLEWYHRSDPRIHLVIEDAKKVDLAKRYIQNHSDNWTEIIGRQAKIPLTTCEIQLVFSNEDKGLGGYYIAGDRALIMFNAHWKLVDSTELRSLATALDIPEHLLYRFRDSECFPNG